jgi:hypothetical protein
LSVKAITLRPNVLGPTYSPQPLGEPSGARVDAALALDELIDVQPVVSMGSAKLVKGNVIEKLGEHGRGGAEISGEIRGSDGSR